MLLLLFLLMMVVVMLRGRERARVKCSHAGANLGVLACCAPVSRCGMHAAWMYLTYIPMDGTYRSMDDTDIYRCMTHIYRSMIHIHQWAYMYMDG